LPQRIASGSNPRCGYFDFGPSSMQETGAGHGHKRGDMDGAIPF